MLSNTLFSILALAVTTLSSPLEKRAERWEVLPPTPALPAPITEVLTPINGVKLWSQSYNSAAGGVPIVMLAGGLGYSAYFGSVIDILIKTHHVIAIDRRGHGRSTFNSGDTFTYDMFAQDTYDLLNVLGIKSANWVGWSDGGITALAALLDSKIKTSINKAFIFAASETYADTNATFTDTSIYSDFVSRCASEYATLQPTANFTEFGTKVGNMEAVLPTWTDADLSAIQGSKVAIAGADHDEAVNLAVAPHLASVIKGSRLVMLKDVSHFAPLQDASSFANAILAAL